MQIYLIVEEKRYRGEKINYGSEWYYLSFTQNKERQDNKLGTFLTDPVFHSKFITVNHCTLTMCNITLAASL